MTVLVILFEIISSLHLQGNEGMDTDFIGFVEYSVYLCACVCSNKYHFMTALVDTK